MAALALAGCHGGEPDAAPSGPRVDLKIDSNTVGSIAVTRTTPLVAALPAAAACLELDAEAADGRFVALPMPAATYPGVEMRLYLSQGRATLGLFRPPPTGVPPAVAQMARQPIVELTDVRSIDAILQPPPAVPDAGLEVGVEGRPPEEISREQLSALPTARGRAWGLKDVLALAPGSASVKAVHVAGETEETFPAAQLPQLTLKLNNKGDFVLQVWGEDTGRPTRQLRGVHSISILAM